MGTERPHKDEIFNAAAEISDVDERASYIAEACGDDSALQAEIEELLGHDDAVDSLLDRSAPGLGATIDQPITEKTGTQIGPYKLLQKVGEGGMGVVYMAEQKEPVKRRVALKIIKPGMDTRQVIARFEVERQALAMMEHPNIAKVLDAGQTNSGRPYFVMELVKGVPVTQYCDEQHLNPRERLELFVPICQAVQHAHQKGIIHRDIKPSNILVALFDGQPVPKVIDFGVAKATSQTLTEKTMFTQLGQVVGTLEYMSPEQAQVNQLDVDTRSDIYSLGVMLYELLTGQTPFDRERLRSAAFDEMLRIIREEEPSKPSTKISSSQSLPSIAANRRIEPAKLGSTIRGELDWIVMKALEKDRGRRYETASKFAEDVQHYLDDEPVVACPPSTRYRLKKFVRRHKASIAVASAFLLAISGGLLGTSLQAARARAAEQDAQAKLDRAVVAENLAERHLEKALAAVDRLLTKVGDEKLKGIPYLVNVRREILVEATEFYRDFAGDLSSDPSTRVEYAATLRRVGALNLAMQELDEARAQARRSLAVLNKARDLQPNNDKILIELARSHDLIARAYSAQGRDEDAIQHLDQGRQCWQDTIPENAPSSFQAREAIASILARKAKCLSGLSKVDEARDCFQEASTMYASLAQSGTETMKIEYAKHLINLGVFESHNGRMQAAKDAYLASGEVARQNLTAAREKGEFMNIHATSLFSLGNIAQKEQDIREAIRFYRRAEEILVDVCRQFPSIPDYRFRLATTRMNAANAFIVVRKLDDAELFLSASARGLERLVEIFPRQMNYRSRLGGVLNGTAMAREYRGDLVGAADAYARAAEHQRAAVRESPRNRVRRVYLRNHLWGLALVQWKLQEQDNAANTIAEAIQLTEELSKEWPETALKGDLETLRGIQKAIAAREAPSQEGDQLRK